MKSILVAAGLMALATAANAQPRQAPNPDTNRDGKVTYAEFQAMQRGGGVLRGDANGDGKVSKAEFQANQKRMAERAQAAGREGPPAGMGDRMFAMLDANKDGFISKAEQEAAQKRRFDMADTNHDGWLSKGELLMMRQNRARGG